MLYQSLPTTWDDARPILQQILQENASTVGKVSGSSRRRPDAPRDLQTVLGSMDVTVSWTAPVNPVDIAGWRVYKDTENNLVDKVSDPSTLQSKIKVSVTSPTAFYVSSVNSIGLESYKVQVIATPLAYLPDGGLIGGLNGVSAWGPATGSGQLGLQARPSSGIGLETFMAGGAERITNSGVAYKRLNDTQASGREIGVASGGAFAAGVGGFFDQTGGAARTYLTSTPNWGFYGSPARGIEMFSGTPARISLASNPSPAWSMNDTATGGREMWANCGGFNNLGMVGWADATASAGRTFLNSTPQHGFYGSPSHAVHIFHPSFDGIMAQGTNPLFMANDTQASGRDYSFNSGSEGAGLGGISDITANAARAYLNSTPQWGWGGSPAVGVESFFGSPIRQTNDSTVGNSPAFAANDTHTGGRQFWWNNGGSNGLGQSGTYDQTANAGRTFLTSSPFWGFYGQPARGIELFSGTPARISLASNPSPAWSMNDTAVGGREFWANEGGYNGTGRGGWADQTAGAARQNVDASGNTDFTGSTPNSGFLSASGVNFSDTSGNLVLKNKTTATGSTVGPTTTSTTYAVLAEMTITVTTKGNKVYISFAAPFNMQSNTSDTNAQWALFKDGSQLSQDYSVSGGHTGASTSVAFWEFMATLAFIDNPTAASHTYDIRWRQASSPAPTGTLIQPGTARTLQVVELG